MWEVTELGACVTRSRDCETFTVTMPIDEGLVMDPYRTGFGDSRDDANRWSGALPIK